MPAKMVEMAVEARAALTRWKILRKALARLIRPVTMKLVMRVKAKAMLVRGKTVQSQVVRTRQAQQRRWRRPRKPTCLPGYFLICRILFSDQTFLV